MIDLDPQHPGEAQPPQHAGRRPVARLVFVLLHLSLAIVGILSVYFLSADLRSHARELKAHFLSGNWEVTTNRQSVESEIRKKYPGSDWSIQFVGGSGQAFSLDPKFRESTIQTIGQKTLNDNSSLSFYSSPLSGSYGDFLADSVLELSRTASPHKQGPLEKLAIMLEDNTPWTRQKRYAENYKRAREILSQLPNGNSLRHALDDYLTFEKGMGPVFPSFPVATQPAYDRDGDWNQQSQALEQEAKCRGTISPLYGTPENILASISISPRVVEVELIRPWLSDTLLDSRSRTGTDLSNRYFNNAGSLRLIPSQMWVLMDDKLMFDLDDASNHDRVAKLSSANNCCKVACDTVSFSLKPDSIRSPKIKSFSGLVDNGTPLLFAIVSRRRLAQ